MASLWPTDEELASDSDVTWGDYGSQLATGAVTDVAGAAAAGVRYLADQFEGPVAGLVSDSAQYLQNQLNDFDTDAFEALSPEAKARVSAEFGDEGFWSSLPLKATRMAPSILASIGAVALAPEAVPAWLAVGASGGALSSGQTINDLFSHVDNFSDDELQEQSPYYRGLRNLGTDEKEARKDLAETMLGATPEILFALGAITSTTGVAGQLTRGLGLRGSAPALGQAGRGVVGRTAVGAGAGGGSEAIQTGAEVYAGETGLVAGGFQEEVDPGAVARGVAEGGILGGVLGAGTDAALGRRRKETPPPPAPTPPPPAPTPQPSATSTTVPAGPNGPPPGAASTAATAPKKTKAPKKKAAAPTTPEVASSAGVEVVASAGPDAATSEAVANAKPATEASGEVDIAEIRGIIRGHLIGDPAPQPPVAPEVAPAPEPPPAAPAPEPTPVPPVTSPGNAPARAPRILVDKAAEAAVRKQTDATLAQNIKSIKAAESGPKGANKSQAEIAAAETTDTVARGLFEGTQVDFDTDYTTPEGRASLGAVLDSIVTAASEAGLQWKQQKDRTIPYVPAKIKAGGATDHTVWLRETFDLAKRLKSKGFVGAKAVERINQYVANLKAARETGDFSNMRGDRKVEGELAKAQAPGGGNTAGDAADTSGNAPTEEIAAAREAAEESEGLGESFDPGVEDVTSLSGTADDKDAVQTTIPKSKRGVARVSAQTTTNEEVPLKGGGKATFEVAEAAGDARKIEITPEVEAAALASLEKASRKTEDVTSVGKAATKVETIKKKAAAKVPPKVGPKGEAAKTKAPSKAPNKTVEKIEAASAKVDAAIAAKRAEIVSKSPKKLTFRAAMRFKGQNIVGDNHPDIFRDVQEGKFGPINMEEFEGADQGFVDQTGKFYTRAEATKIVNADSSTSIARSRPYGGRLFSEDIKGKEFEAPAIEAEGKAQLKEERAKVEPDPSPAQAASGVYPKGHLPKLVPGHVVAIETAKGGVRKNKDPKGPAWQVTMKHDYGHILGTKGADGDPIDVTLGPKAWPGNPELEVLPVIVIDQHVPGPDGPGKFDEHKTFIGFDDVRDAMEAYFASFSEPMEVTANRFNNPRALSREEFKEWLKDWKSDLPTAEETALGREAVFEVERTEQTGFGPAILPGQVSSFEELVNASSILPHPWDRFGPRPADWLTAVSLETTDVESVLKRLTDNLSRSAVWSRLEGDNLAVARAVMPAMTKRLSAIIRDLPVHIVPEAEILSYTRGKPAGGFYDAGMDRILISDTMAADPGVFAHVAFHEATHAAFLASTWKSAPARAAIERIAREARDAGLNPEIYAFSNLDEFVAESFSNPSIQRVLAGMEASQGLKVLIRQNSSRTIGRQIRTLWDAMVGVVHRTLGLPGKSYSLLRAIMQVGAELEFTVMEETRTISAQDQNLRTRELSDRLHLPDSPWRDSAFEINIAPFIDRLTNSTALQEQKGAPWLLRIQTMDSVARGADRFFPGNNPVRKIADIVEATAVTAKRLFNADAKIVSEFAALQRTHQASGQWDEFASLVHDETETGVFIDQPIDSATNAAIVGKDTMHGPWLKQQHPELHRRWQALPDDLKAARTKALDFYAKQQEAMAFGTLKNRVLKLLGIDDEAMARRIFNGTQTAADEALLGDARDAVIEAKELSKLRGPYVPLMRRGDWVVRATQKITSPGNATQLAPNVWEFSGPDARDRAIAWGNSHGGIRPTVTSVWVDANTGKKFVTDPQTGKEIRITKNDADAENRFRVELQNKTVEFYDSKKEALAAAKELEDAGLEVMGTVARRDDRTSNSDLVSFQIRELGAALGRRKAVQDMTPRMQNELKQALAELSLRMLGSTRIQSKRLQRTNVRGASRDFTRNMMEYSHSSAGHIAKLQHMPQLDAAMKEMRELADGDYSKDTALGRSTIANEIEDRVNSNNGHQEGKKYSPWVSRVLATSFIDKLASVSYSVINATQPTLLTTPILAARYGMARSVTAMTRAYADVGAGSIVARGAKDTVKLARAPLAETASFLGDIKSRVNSREAAMFQHLADVGTIDPEGGLEVEKIVPSLKKGTVAGRAGAGLDASIGYLEGIARQMPKAIEMVNRSVTALAAYRLEMKRSRNHEAAVQYAQDMVNQTQFNYSATNAPPVFNHPLARLAFQFKKFGLGVYQILGQQIGKAIHNANPGDRAEAVKALAYIAAMHAAAAGALGLPTEPFKALVLAANAAGLTDYTWGDVEAEAREFAAGMFGSTTGEIVTRGLPRALGIDVSGRLGLDNLMIFGEPRTDDTRDVWGWFTEMAAGAPGGLMRDWHKGVGKLVDGDFVEAAEVLVPVKTFGDAIKAYRVASEGKKSARTGIETLSPYSFTEAAARVIGFTPAREAEATERASNFYAKSGREQEQRQAFMADWANSTPGERMRLWGRIELWNRGKDRDGKLTRTRLNKYVKDRRTALRKGTIRDGIRTNKRNSRYLEDTEGVYNVK